MRPLWLVVLVVPLAGCQKAPLLHVHGKPVGDWVAGVHDPNALVRLKSVRVLGNIGAVDPSVVPGLTEALGDREAAVRDEAALALVKIGPAARSAEAALAAAAQHDPSTQVRRHAARALERLR